jgi:hypothetical protein
MTLANMRAQGVRSLSVRLPPLPPRGGDQRGRVRRCGGAAELRTAHDLLVMRHRRRGRAAELGRATQARNLDRDAVAIIGKIVGASMRLNNSRDAQVSDTNKQINATA